MDSLVKRRLACEGTQGKWQNDSGVWNSLPENHNLHHKQNYTFVNAKTSFGRRYIKQKAEATCRGGMGGEGLSHFKLHSSALFPFLSYMG